MDEVRERLPNQLFGRESDERLDGRVEVGNHTFGVDTVNDIADFFYQVALLFL